jgi:hypothetical protein
MLERPVLTRRTVFFGLIDLPFDPFLALLIAAVTFAELKADLQGDVIRTVDGVVIRAHDGGLAGQVRDRLIVAVMVGLLWVIPVLARRSRRAALGEPTRRRFLVHDPWHRDWLVWFAVAMSVLAAGAHRGPSSQVSGAGVRRLTGSWLPVLGTALLEATFLGAVILGVVGGLRGLYRALGDPAKASPR